MHVIFLAPDTHVYNHRFVRALKRAGARVSGIGPQPQSSLTPEIKHLLDAYVPAAKLLDASALLRIVRTLEKAAPVDLIETIDEPMVEVAAKLRGSLGIPGLSLQTATLCRDKASMKEFLRKHGVPCAASAPVSTPQEVQRFVEEQGFPIILKPRAGFGSLGTFRVDNDASLKEIISRVGLDRGASMVAEEFIQGHEGFYDTLTLQGEIVQDFVSHYFPGCLEALQDSRISPQIAVTNRVNESSYQELREMGAKVSRLLGLERSATHMEWFFGQKGLKFSEIGARPAGEKIWDMYKVGNDYDIYEQWASAVLHGRSTAKPSRRLAVGSVQVRPERDGVVTGYTGLDQVHKSCGRWIYEANVPRPGSRTLPMEKGWLVNTWFRLYHPDYDTLRRMMTFIGETVVAQAR